MFLYIEESKLSNFSIPAVENRQSDNIMKLKYSPTGLKTRDFYKVIVVEGEPQINYNLIEIESDRVIVQVESGIY